MRVGAWQRWRRVASMSGAVPKGYAKAREGQAAIEHLSVRSPLLFMESIGIELIILPAPAEWHKARAAHS